MTASEAWRPRGPRFVPLATLPFVAVALLPIVQSAPSWSLDLSTDPVGWLRFTLAYLIPRVALPLIGAALVARHPRARRHQPWLLLGAILLAAETLGRTLPVHDGLLELFPSADPVFGLTLASTAFAQITSIVGSLGFLALARGLQRARGPRRTAAGGAMTAVVAVVAVATVVGQVYAYYSSPTWFDTGAATRALIGLGTAAAALHVIAIGRLGIVAARGWADGEAPSRGWAMAGIGAWFMLLAGLLSLALIIGLAAIGIAWTDLGVVQVVVVEAVGLAWPIGTLLLLAAFVVGLPASEDIRWYDLEELDRAAP